MAERPTEQQHSAAVGIQSRAGAAVLADLLAAQVAAAGAVGAAVAALDRAATLAADTLRQGGRLAYAGAGSAGLMALADALELAGTFGIPPDRTPVLFAGGADALLHMTGLVEDDAAAATAEVARLGLGDGDAVICVSASGSTPYTLAAAQAAGAAGAAVIGIANVSGAALLARADVAVLLDTGPEVIAGSTRMGAGTAQKVALNMLSTLIGIRLGHVHDGYMVNLTADNAKLRSRARGIVAAIAGCDDASAGEALARSGGAVKPAVLLARGADPAAADAALQAGGGHLGPALAALPSRANATQEQSAPNGPAATLKTGT